MLVISLAGRQLNLRWPGLLVLLVCLPILLRLGFWQLDRAEFKAQLLADLSSAESRPAISLLDVARLETLPPNTKVTLRGEYLAGRSALLDNRYYQGRPGFNVISLFKLAGSEKLLLVNRGWVALGKYRYPLPDIAVPTGVVVLQGQIRPVPTDIVVLEKERFEQWPELVQNVDLEQLSRLGGQSISTVWILLLTDSDATLLQDWPVTIVGPQRHYGYAVQWFGLAIALIVVWAAASISTTGEKKSD